MEKRGFNVDACKVFTPDINNIPKDGIFSKIHFPDEVIEYNNDIIIETGVNGLTYSDIQEKEALMVETAKFFGVPFYRNQKLLFDICHVSYMIGEWHIKDEHGETVDIIDISSRYQTFLEALNELDSIKKYIATTCPQFETKQAEYRRQFKKLAKEINSVRFFRILDWFFTNYKDLNKLEKAKVDTLLHFNFPNIGQKEAEEIVKMLNNKEKFHKKK